MQLAHHPKRCNGPGNLCLCLLPDGNSGQRTMQVALPVVPRSPAPLASRSEKELGCCVLAGIPSDDLLAPQRFLEMAKAMGTPLSTSSVTPGAPLPTVCKFPAGRRGRVFVLSASQCKETLGMKEWQSENAVFPSTHSRAVRSTRWWVMSEATML